MSKPYQKGFSLVELMVALVFISLLMAGMLDVYAASIKGFRQANETIEAQRTNRWAMGQMQDDLQSAGYSLPYWGTMPSVSNPLVVLPNNPAPVGTIPTVPGPTDEIRFLMDQPLAITAQLSAVPANESTLQVKVLSGTMNDALPGDYVILLDRSMEAVQILSLSGITSTSATITLDPSAGTDLVTGNGNGVNPKLASLTHQPGTDLIVVRPSQLVRYSIQARATDPSNSTLMVPCLVRQQRPFPSGSDGAAVFAVWNQEVIVAENVVGLNIDVSVSGGTTWQRTGVAGIGTAGWGTIAANINTVLTGATKYTLPGYTDINSTANPLWYRFIPTAFRMDLTTSTRQRLSQSTSNATNATRFDNYGYRLRKQTLLVTPRNSTAGI